MGRPELRHESSALVWRARVQLGARVLLSAAIIGIGASAWAVTTPAGVRIAGFLLVGLGAGVVLDAVAQDRTRAPEISVAALDAVATTAAVRTGARFAVGMAMVAVAALTVAAWAALALVAGQAGWALVLGAAASWTASVVVLAAAGRYTAGGLWFTPAGVTYRWRGLQTIVSWDGIGLVIDEPSRGYVALRGRPGTNPRHGFRAGPWHGEKLAAPDVALLRVEGTALSPAGLKRIVEHYAGHPEARRELGTSTSVATMTDLNRGP